ncbi:NAD(P)H-binding protein [Stackebrandtia nassauensis]|uniref:NmrA family protein n=1 Tax=Stackebrandtia nassauensis (strain DSM 44728 / CIP 108903 / NRRL B-16338 / NBRC 102104 / LLR-40K-21) TaxID=446470 RepID=D3PX33_STANL|nr:NAD(P)H-binding protein [Stackebrandtia nassauensis]ADD45257.1 NmrA family protein [Stackebrandtia nassauensis DSM 44728]
MTYLVAGATGTIGRHIIKHLLATGQPVRALTRNPDAASLPENVEVVTGDLSRPETLRAVFDGVTAAHLLSASGDDHTPLRTGAEIAALATRAGVQRVTAISPGLEGPLEQALAASELKWTLLWPIDYMANTLGWSQAIRDDGVVREPYGSRKTASVDESDIGAVAAHILINGGHDGQTYKLTGPQTLTPADKVNALATATGLPLNFAELTDDQARDLWRSQGWSEEGIEFMLNMWATVPDSVGHVNSSVEKILGRAPRSFTQWATEHANAFRV